MVRHPGQQFVSRKPISFVHSDRFCCYYHYFAEIRLRSGEPTMAPTSLATALPNEIVDQILSSPNLQIIDVMNFAFTCKRFYWIVVNCNKLWKVKFFQRWPSVQGIFDNQRPEWFEETKTRMRCCRKLVQKLDSMLEKHDRKLELGPYDLTEYDELFLPDHGADPMNYHYLVDELINLINQPIDQSNLTHKFYATYVLNYLRQTHLTKEWKEFVALPVKLQMPERGALFLAQWNQPLTRINVGVVLTILDQLANETMALVAERYPDNNLNSATPEELAKWKVEILDDNVWSGEDSKAIVTCLCEIIFKKYNFTAVGRDIIWYSRNSFLDEAMMERIGTPAVLAVIVESAARRLGIRCEYTSLTDHCLLRWKERYQVDEGVEVENFYFDVFFHDGLTSKDQWLINVNLNKFPIEDFNQQPPMTVTQLVRLMVNNVVQTEKKSLGHNGRTARTMNILHLQQLVNPLSYTNVFALINFYTSQDMDISGHIESFKHVLSEGRYQADYVKNQVEIFMNGETIRRKRIKAELSRQLTPKKRTDDVKFAVGMVMKNPLRKQCVIVGWDTKLKEECKLKSHMKPSPHVLSLAPQPYYHVYNDDGTCEYLPQEQLFLSPWPEYVNNHEIGRHFYKYVGPYYMPNKSKAREYPEDLEILDQFRAIGDHVKRTSTS